MSHTDLSDFSPEFAYSDPYSDRWVILEKLGGGTVGESYSGTWRYIVVDSVTREELARGQNYTSRMPHTHKWVAEDIADIFT